MRKFQLNEELELIEADPREFSINYTIYALENVNNWFPTKMERSFKIYEDVEDAFFINNKDKRIGGVMIRPNKFGLLFLIPPFSDEWTILKALVPFVDSISNKDKSIEAIFVYPKSYTNLQRLGFQIKDTEKTMIRPTAPFNINWDEGIYVDIPSLENINKMIGLYYEVYRESNIPSLANKEIDFYKELLSEQMQEVEKDYSTLIFDKKTNELVAVCMITMWEELPYVADIVVKNSHKGRGLGTMMLKKALNNSLGKYFALRLAVKPGNRAEGLYHQLGFISGIESSSMILKR